MNNPQVGGRSAVPSQAPAPSSAAQATTRSYLPTKAEIKHTAAVLTFGPLEPPEATKSFRAFLKDVPLSFCQRLFGATTLMGCLFVLDGSVLLGGGLSEAEPSVMGIGLGVLAVGAGIAMGSWRLAKHFHRARFGDLLPTPGSLESA